MTLPVAILAGGLGARMRPRTETVPKALLEVAGEPFLFRQLRLLRGRGVERAVICAGHMVEQIRPALAGGETSHWRNWPEIAWSEDGEKALGTGGALKKALPALGNVFMVLYGDSWLEMDYPAVADAFLRSGAPALMSVYRNRGTHEQSNAVFQAGRVTAYSKRGPTADMEYIDYGLGCFQGGVFHARPGDVFDLADVYADMATAGDLAGYEATERFYEIGSPQGLRELEEHLIKGIMF